MWENWPLVENCWEPVHANRISEIVTDQREQFGSKLVSKTWTCRKRSGFFFKIYLDIDIRGENSMERNTRKWLSLDVTFVRPGVYNQLVLQRSTGRNGLHINETTCLKRTQGTGILNLLDFDTTCREGDGAAFDINFLQTGGKTCGGEARLQKIAKTSEPQNCRKEREFLFVQQRTLESSDWLTTLSRHDARVPADLTLMSRASESSSTAWSTARHQTKTNAGLVHTLASLGACIKAVVIKWGVRVPPGYAKVLSQRVHEFFHNET